jgi:membrane protease YdiL (CAAX protease family)
MRAAVRDSFAAGGISGWPTAGWVLGSALVTAAGLAGLAAGLSPARLAMLLLIGPLAEEAVFRAGLQEALLRRGVIALSANLLTALAFGLAHAVARGDIAALAVVAPALLIGASYGRWRQLRLCVALHAALNAAWIGVTISL